MLRSPAAIALGFACVLASGCDPKPEVKPHTACSETQEKCGDVCATLATDREHCGACGNVCGAGEICVDGACELNCPRPLVSCDGRCVDVDRDPAHCGKCERACDDGLVCVNGGCNTACPAGQLDCGGRCVDPKHDPAHCGGCGMACDTGDACVDGSCETCVSGTMEGPLPMRVSGVAQAGVSQHEISCGFDVASGSPDVAFALVAPSSGVFEIDSEGSETDVLLALLDRSCRGRTLACADTTESSRERTLRVALDEGETVVVVAESKSAEGGLIRLRVSQVEKQAPSADACAPIVLGSEVPKTVTGDTTDGVDLWAAKCGVASSPEVLYQFTAPATGRYEFDTFGSNFDTVLSVLKGGCEGEQIACNDDVSSGSGEASAVSVKLAAGESVLVLVEGMDEAGKFTLHVSASSIGDLDPCCFESPIGGCGNEAVEECVCALDEYCCTLGWDVLCAELAQTSCELSCKPPLSDCEVTDLGSTVPQTVTGTTIGALNVLAPSCSTDGSPERLYSFTAPEAGSYGFDTAGSSYDTVVYVLAGTCAGEEKSCNDDYGQSSQSRAIVTLAEGETVVVAVDGYGGEADDFVLNVMRMDGDDVGDCCSPHETGGCSVPAIQTCVCDFDAYCCDADNGWDDICVSVAATQCDVCL